MKVSMNGCGAHDRQISTSGVSDEPMSGISPAYITVKLKQKGAGVWKVKFKLMPLGFYTSSTLAHLLWARIWLKPDVPNADE
jgi:hypothetical protein